MKDSDLIFYLVATLTNIFSSLTGSLLYADQFKNMASFGKYFSSGVFFSIFFFDLFPDSIGFYKASDLPPNLRFLFFFVPFLLSFGVFLVLGKLIEDQSSLYGFNEESSQLTDIKTKYTQSLYALNDNGTQKQSSRKIFWTFFMHEFITGIFLALLFTRDNKLNAFAAIILHKSLEGFSLGVKFRINGDSFIQCLYKNLILSFTLLVGSLVGGLASDFFSRVILVTNSILLGSFLYITVEENQIEIFKEQQNLKSQLKAIGFWFSGIVFSFLIYSNEMIFA